MSITLDDAPFSPWRFLGPAQQGGGPASLMERLGLEMFATLYEALLDRQRLGPREVDELEVWECARLLGIGTSTPTLDAVEMNRRRVEARSQGLPEPQWETPGGGEDLLLLQHAQTFQET